MGPQLMLMLNLDSMEDTMVDILVDTMAMVAMEAMCITWARGLLTLTLNLDSMEDIEDGGYGYYRGKRSADAEAVATADADAEPGFYGGYYGGHLGGYHGYGGYG